MSTCLGATLLEGPSFVVNMSGGWVRQPAPLQFGPSGLRCSRAADSAPGALIVGG